MPQDEALVDVDKLRDVVLAHILSHCEGVRMSMNVDGRPLVLIPEEDGSISLSLHEAGKTFMCRLQIDVRIVSVRG
jgi:hypothetical protein